MKTAQDLVSAAKAGITEIPIEQAEQAIKLADVLIDVREADEFATGHVAQAINIPRGLLEFKLSSDPALQDRGLKAVLYCKTSGRAALAAEVMKEMGYLHVQSIAGGFDAWAAAGKYVAKPTLPAFE
ncbi:Rhodanese-related sulfurtransferase [Alteromonadaceae bacterium Bs31]|nr:Rhodanese-related sulfurtransferase [Alteromonadaceae bacterium Bs31]